MAQGVNQDCWLLEYPCQFVLCRHVKCRSAGLRLVDPTARREYWSIGVLGVKAEIDLIFTILPLWLGGCTFNPLLIIGQCNRAHRREKNSSMCQLGKRGNWPGKKFI